MAETITLTYSAGSMPTNFQNLRQQTLNVEREQARAAADAGVADMPLT